MFKTLTQTLAIFAVLTPNLLFATSTTPPYQIANSGPTIDFEFRADGTYYSKGVYGGTSSFSSSDYATGTKMFWYPDTAAFRAGGLDSSGNSTAWNPSYMGYYSFAFGLDTVAMGSYSTAFGYYATASNSSTAIGYATYAPGLYSASFGYHTSAVSESDFVIGYYNSGAGSSNSLVSTDPIFEIGNGSSTTPSDAFQVDKSGDVSAHGVMRCSPGGDLTMGSFVAGTHP